MEYFIGACGTVGGCQLSIFTLELIPAGSPHTYYALTFLQYGAVCVLALPLVLQRRRRQRQSSAAAAFPFPLELRPSRVPLHRKCILAVWSWAFTVMNNSAFDLGVSVPVHATFRSSSLLLNMIAGWAFLGRRFSLLQILCVVVISASLAALSFEKAQRQQQLRQPADLASAGSAVAAARQLSGMALLVLSTTLGVGMSVYQESMMRDAAACAPQADERERGEPAPLWAEVLFSSHLVGVLLFPVRMHALQHGLHSLGQQPSHQHLVLANCLCQFVCISGVYVFSGATSAFTLTLALTLRKVGTFFLSVLYFRHYRRFTVVEWVTLTSALAAGTAYSFLPKAARAAEARPPQKAP